jgi:hypothetical protein
MKGSKRVQECGHALQWCICRICCKQMIRTAVRETLERAAQTAKDAGRMRVARDILKLKVE